MARAGADKPKAVFIEQEVIIDAMIGQTGWDRIELSYGEAFEIIAEWWEAIRQDGINVAAEVQRCRNKITG